MAPAIERLAASVPRSAALGAGSVTSGAELILTGGACASPGSSPEARPVAPRAHGARVMTRPPRRPPRPPPPPPRAHGATVMGVPEPMLREALGGRRVAPRPRGGRPPAAAGAAAALAASSATASGTGGSSERGGSTAASAKRC